MNHFRVEVYEGCSLTLSRVFGSREDADQYRDSHLLEETRVIAVDENGAAKPSARSTDVSVRWSPVETPHRMR
jgi:hypothetical protein